jgi:hypothetical protein
MRMPSRMPQCIAEHRKWADMATHPHGEKSQQANQQRLGLKALIHQASS